MLEGVILMAKEYRIVVYKCLECGEFVTEYDLEEHCMICSATIEDFEDVGEYIVKADDLPTACDKAIQMARFQ